MHLWSCWLWLGIGLLFLTDFQVILGLPDNCIGGLEGMDRCSVLNSKGTAFSSLEVGYFWYWWERSAVLRPHLPMLGATFSGEAITHIIQEACALISCWQNLISSQKTTPKVQAICLAKIFLIYYKWHEIHSWNFSAVNAGAKTAGRKVASGWM